MTEASTTISPPFAGPVLAQIGKVRMTLDPSWLPHGALLYWWLERLAMPALVPELDRSAYRSMALLGILGLAVAITAKGLALALVALRPRLTFELRLTPLGVVTLAGRALRLRDELLLELTGILSGGILGLVVLIGWFKLADAATPLWLGGTAFFLGLAIWGVSAATLLPAWPLGGGRLLRRTVERLSGSPALGGQVALVGTSAVALGAVAAGLYWAFTEAFAGGILLAGAALLLLYLAWLDRLTRPQ